MAKSGTSSLAIMIRPSAPDVFELNNTKASSGNCRCNEQELQRRAIRRKRMMTRNKLLKARRRIPAVDSSKSTNAALASGAGENCIAKKPKRESPAQWWGNKRKPLNFSILAELRIRDRNDSITGSGNSKRNRMFSVSPVDAEFLSTCELIDESHLYSDQTNDGRDVNNLQHHLVGYKLSQEVLQDKDFLSDFSYSPNSTLLFAGNVNFDGIELLD